MATKIVDKWDQVRSQSDAIAYARNKGAQVEHDSGKYYRISTEKGTVHICDNCRAEPKQGREWLRFLFWSLGLVSVLALAVFILGMGA